MELALATVYINMLVQERAMPEVWERLAGENIHLVIVLRNMNGKMGLVV